MQLCQLYLAVCGERALEFSNNHRRKYRLATSLRMQDINYKLYAAK
jgi:hypothetical protein